MPVKHKNILLLCVVVYVNLSPGFVHGQRQELIFDKITDESGRSLGHVTGLAQDEYGFLWFATREGLYRYDGYNYKLFRKDVNDSTSLPFNDITFLYKDKSNHLWLRHYDQLSVFRREKLVHAYDSLLSYPFALDVRIIEDKNNNLWIGPTQQGLMKYDKTNDSIQWYRSYQSTYPPALHKYVSALEKGKAKIQIDSAVNNTDTMVSFQVSEETVFLVISSVERGMNGFYDFGRVLQNNITVWSPTKDKLKYAGGAEKNQVQIDVIRLQPGNYQLHFHADGTHAFQMWEGESPVYNRQYGITLIPLSQGHFRKNQTRKTDDFANAETDKILRLIDQPYSPDNAISSDEIKDMLINNEGRLCLLTDRGIDVYDEKKKSFESIPVDYQTHLERFDPHSHVCFIQNQKNHYWIGTNDGILVYHPEKKSYTTYRNSPENDSLLAGNVIYTLFEDYRGNIWIGTDEGLSVYKAQHDRFYTYRASNRNRLYSNKIFKIYEDNSKNIWIATFEGLNKMRRSRFTFHDLKIQRYVNFPLIRAQDGTIWYRGQQNRLTSYDRESFQHTNHNIKSEIFPVDPYTDEVDYSFSDLYEDSQARLWVLIQNKLYRFNRHPSILEHVLSIDEGYDFYFGKTYSMFETNGHQLWIISEKGVYPFDREKDEMGRLFAFEKSNTYDEQGDFIKYIYQDKSDNFWIRTAGGIFYFNTRQKKIRKVYAFRNDFSASLAEGNIAEDHQGNIWFSALPYLYKMNRNDRNKGMDSIQEYHFEGLDDVGFCNVFPHQGIIWIYTNNGLFRYHENSDAFDSYTYLDGLIDNNINGMVEEDSNHLWITTLKGISRFNIQNESFKNYFRPNDDISYHFKKMPRHFKQPDDELIFITTKGLVTHFPDSINKRPPRIQITRFELFGQEYELDSLVYRQKQIRLKHDQNHLSFRFSALDFTNPSQNKYAFKMEGIDKNWKHISASERRVTYTTVDPGEYVFKVKGCNNDQIWNEKGQQLHIVITPPWYKTKVAYAGYVVLLIVGIYAFIKVRERNLILEKRILEQKVKERTAQIEQQKEEITSQRDMIYEQNEAIKDSIYYAQRIQRAVLPPNDIIKQLFPEFFILFKPRDIVSGDFYWLSEKEGKVVVVAADCTGHGVPGAFMSMLGVAFLNEIVNKTDELQANTILSQLRAQVIKFLHQERADHQSKDGMDLALCIFDKNNHLVQYAGAFNPLLMIRNGELRQIKADRMPIGIYEKKDEFVNHQFEVKEGDLIYMFSDGYTDQFAGTNMEKFKMKRFKELLLKIHRESMETQKQMLDETIEKWRKGIEQVDDILVMGIKCRGTGNGPDKE